MLLQNGNENKTAERTFVWIVANIFLINIQTREEQHFLEMQRRENRINYGNGTKKYYYEDILVLLHFNYSEKKHLSFFYLCPDIADKWFAWLIWTTTSDFENEIQFCK